VLPVNTVTELGMLFSKHETGPTFAAAKVQLGAPVPNGCPSKMNRQPMMVDSTSEVSIATIVNGTGGGGGGGGGTGGPIGPFG